MKTYHSALRSKTPKTLPYQKTISPGPIYDPKLKWNTVRKHDLKSISRRTRSLDYFQVREPERPSATFQDNTPRFESLARPGTRPSKITGQDYFKLGNRDGGMYRFGSQFM